MINVRYIARLMVIAICLLALPAWAEGDGKSDQETIKAMIGKCADALQKQDWAALESMCAADWKHLSQDQYLDMNAVKGLFTGHITEHTINFSNIDVHVSGDGSMAWATFNEATEYKFDGNPVKQSAVFTAVFEKADGAWMMKILHRSVAPPPADN